MRAKIFAGVFHGCEVADLKDSQIDAMTAAGIDIQHSKNDRHDRDWWSATSTEGRDLDPHLQTFVRRSTAVRQATAKRPKTLRSVSNTVRAYARQQDAQKRWHGNGDGVAPPEHYEQAVMMNGKGGSIAPWKDRISACGPIGLFIQALHLIGCKVDAKFRTQQRGEVPIDMIHMPCQYLGSLLYETAAGARTAAVADFKDINRRLEEIDVQVTHQFAKTLSKEKRVFCGRCKPEEDTARRFCIVLA